jgi:hypothetical protein
MKVLFVLAALLSANQAMAKSCIPTKDNPQGCQGVPDLNVKSCIPTRDNPQGCQGIPDLGSIEDQGESQEEADESSES